MNDLKKFIEKRLKIKLSADSLEMLLSIHPSHDISEIEENIHEDYFVLHCSKCHRILDGKINYENQTLILTMANPLQLPCDVVAVFKPITPEEFYDRVMEIYKIQSVEEFETDWRGARKFESCHNIIDDLLWDLLESLGYEKGIAIIKKAPAWYD